MNKYFKLARLELSSENFPITINIDINDSEENYKYVDNNHTIYHFFLKDTKPVNISQLGFEISNQLKKINCSVNIDINPQIDNSFLFENIILGLTDVNVFKQEYTSPSVYTINCPQLSTTDYNHAYVNAKGYHLARMLNHLPFSKVNSDSLAANISSILANDAFKITILRADECKELKMNGVLAVAQGSYHEPAVIKIEYKTCDKPKIGLVGKGIMFDSGGYNLKSGDFTSMKTDMAGCGAVIGCLKAIADGKVEANLVAYLMTTDNLLNEKAYIPGDIIHYSNGLSVEVGNTDAEGRLVLADGLLQIANDNCDTVIDIATLTGSSATSLGKGLAPLYSTNQDVTNIFTNLNYSSTDNVWPMPLPQEYEPLIAGDITDIKNISSTRHAGSIMAAIFLKQFAPKDCNWVHIDMGAMSRKEENGAPVNGYGVRLLTNFIEKYSNSL